MGWWKAIWALVVALFEILGHRYDWVKEEINSKPKDSVM
jgi:hypothetical protein